MIPGTIQGLLRRYGRTVILRRTDQTYQYPAYISPNTHRNRQYLDERYAQLGSRDPNTFLYLGSVEGGGGLLRPGDLVEDGGRLFYVSVCETLWWKDRPACMWALLKPTQPEEEAP